MCSFLLHHNFNILHSVLQMAKYSSAPDLSNQSHVFAFWMLHSHLTCLLLQQAALGGPVIVAPAISHLLQSGHIHRGEPWQRLQVPREVLLPQLGGVCGQKPSREKWEEERGVGEGDRIEQGLTRLSAPTHVNRQWNLNANTWRENFVLTKSDPL